MNCFLFIPRHHSQAETQTQTHSLVIKYDFCCEMLACHWSVGCRGFNSNILIFSATAFLAPGSGDWWGNSLPPPSSFRRNLTRGPGKTANPTVGCQTRLTRFPQKFTGTPRIVLFLYNKCGKSHSNLWINPDWLYLLKRSARSSMLDMLTF